MLEPARRLVGERDPLVFNFDKCGYASNLTSIGQVLAELGNRASTPNGDSPVDRSIEEPGAFIEGNVSGTFLLLQAV